MSVNRQSGIIVLSRLWNIFLFPVGWLILYGGLFSPLLGNLIANLVNDPNTSYSLWYVINEYPRPLALLARTILLALGVAGISGGLGWLAALALWSRSNRDRSFFSGLWPWLALALIVLPPYVHTLSWVRLEAWFLLLARRSGWPGAALYGWGGVIWVESAVYLPLAFIFAWLGFSQINPDLISAARLSGPDSRLVRRVLLPLSAPYALTGAGLVFLLSLLEYGVPSLLGLNTYPLEIFAEFSLTASPGRAFLLALPLFSVAWLVLLVLLHPLRRIILTARIRQSPWHTPPLWPFAFNGLLRFGLLVAAVQVFLPLVGLAWQIGGLPSLARTIASSYADGLFSIQVNIVGLLLALPLAWRASAWLLSQDSGRWFAWFAVLSPVAMPSALVGIGLASLPGMAPGLGFLRNGLLLPALAVTARFLPLATLGLLAARRSLDPVLLEAGQVFQPSGWRRLLWIHLPLLAPGVFTVSGLFFAWGLGELGATLLTVPPGKATLTLRIYNYLHYGASQEVAGQCLVLVLAVLLVGMGWVMAARWGWRRFNSGLDLGRRRS